jgi:hypothetical protein
MGLYVVLLLEYRKTSHGPTKVAESSMCIRRQIVDNFSVQSICHMLRSGHSVAHSRVSNRLQTR